MTGSINDRDASRHWKRLCLTMWNWVPTSPVLTPSRFPTTPSVGGTRKSRIDALELAGWTTCVFSCLPSHHVSRVWACLLSISHCPLPSVTGTLSDFDRMTGFWWWDRWARRGDGKFTVTETHKTLWIHILRDVSFYRRVAVLYRKFVFYLGGSIV